MRHALKMPSEDPHSVSFTLKAPELHRWLTAFLQLKSNCENLLLICSHGNGGQLKYLWFNSRNAGICKQVAAFIKSFDYIISFFDSHKLAP